MTVPEFNALPAPAAADLLRSCCAASRWVDALVARRPFRHLGDLMAAAGAAWQGTGPADWEEAFAHHPRIGEAQAAAAVSETARSWSVGEQRGIAGAESPVRAGLERGNREYERRFGRIFIVSASGKRAEQLLENLRSRLANAPADELRIAAEEQGKIAQVRLRKLFSD